MKELPKKYITIDTRIAGGKPVLKGTRIPVQLIFDYLANGWGLYELPTHFEGIDTDLVSKLIKYQGMQYSSDDGAKTKRS